MLYFDITFPPIRKYKIRVKMFYKANDTFKIKRNVCVWWSLWFYSTWGVPQVWVQKCFHQSLDLQLQQNHIKRAASHPAFPWHPGYDVAVMQDRTMTSSSSVSFTKWQPTAVRFIIMFSVWKCQPFPCFLPPYKVRLHHRKCGDVCSTEV